MRKQPTPEQKAKAQERREKFRTLWKQIADMPELERVQISNKLGVVTVEGRQLSLNNQCLLALQFPTVSVVGGFRQWLDQGRCVRKGQHGLMIWVPAGAGKDGESSTPKAPQQSERNIFATPATGTATASAAGETERPNFFIGTVFDISQTDALENSLTENVETATAA
jgi:hypothetical protein